MVWYCLSKSKKLELASKDETVRVVVRCRPMEQKEITGNYQRVVEMDTKRGLVSIKKPNSNEETKEFTYDAVYDWKYKPETKIDT